MNLFDKEASHQRAKYLNYMNLNKSFSKKKTRVIIDDPSESDSFSISEADNSPDEGEKASITYDSESGNSDEGSNNSTDTRKEVWNNGCRDGFIIDKLNNSKYNIKEHKLSSTNLDKALHHAHLSTLCENHIKG